MGDTRSFDYRSYETFHEYGVQVDPKILESPLIRSQMWNTHVGSSFNGSSSFLV